MKDSWARFESDQPPFALRYPAPLPSGAAVTVDEERRNGRRRLHVYTDDRRELYFEVMAYPELASPVAIYDRLVADVTGRLPGAAATALSAAVLDGRPADNFSLLWRTGARHAYIVDVDRCTYRVIFDPRSVVNHQVLATLRLGAAGDDL